MDKLSMEVRMLIAFLLILGVFGLNQYFNPPPPQEQPKQVTAKATAPPPPAAKAPAEAPEPTRPVPGAIQAEQVQTFAIDTNVFQVVFSNRGGTVHNWVLKKYKDGKGKPLDLVNQIAFQLGEKAPPAPFTLSFRNPPSGSDVNNALYKVARSDDGLGVTFEYSDGKVLAKKTFQFTKDSYLVRVTSQVTENGVLVPHSLQWRGGFGDFSSSNPTADARSLYYDSTNSSLNKKQASDAKDGPISASGTFGFAGVEDRYFAAVGLPGANSSLELTTYSDIVPNAETKKDEPHVGAALGGSGVLDFQVYVGPKDADFLRTVDPRLAQLIDWGWYRVIAQPMFVILHWTVNTLTHNWGWAIVLFTIAINIVLMPLRLTSMKSSKKMQAIQPEVARLNEKYKGVAMNDPRKQQQNQELMDLYKKHGINPVGGCLPMLIQIPFFFALYKVLSITIELRGAPWLWVSDLSQPEQFAIRILPLLLVVTQFLSQKMTPSPGMDPTQQKMMLFMPLVFGYMFWFASAGLVLYWLTSNVTSIAQQWLLNRNTPAPAVAVVVPAKKKK
jgi:YidC/Oxa1 family membrane protein insertase